MKSMATIYRQAQPSLRRGHWLLCPSSSPPSRPSAALRRPGTASPLIQGSSEGARRRARRRHPPRESRSRIRRRCPLASRRIRPTRRILIEWGTEKLRKRRGHATQVSPAADQPLEVRVLLTSPSCFLIRMLKLSNPRLPKKAAASVLKVQWSMAMRSIPRWRASASAAR